MGPLTFMFNLHVYANCHDLSISSYVLNPKNNFIETLDFQKYISIIYILNDK